MSALEECLALGEAELVRDLVTGADLRTVMAEDLRVLGVAYRVLGQLLESEQTLERAVAMGSPAARIDLARTMSFDERQEDAWAEVNLLDVQSLAAPDQAYAHRLRSELRHELESYEVALPDARMACRIATGLPQRAVVLPWCQITLGVTYEQLGDDLRALHLFQQLRDLPVYGYPYHLVNEARVLLQLGRLDDARPLIAQLGGQVQTDHARRIWQRLHADQVWLDGDLPVALTLNLQAARDADDAFSPVQAVSAYFRAALLAAHLNKSSEALRCLSRAEHLAASRGMRALVEGYGATVRLRLGVISPEAALVIIGRARAQLAARAERPDERDMQLHACEAARLISPVALEQELNTLRDLMRQVGHPGMLSRSWTLFPHLKAVLDDADRQMLCRGEAPARLRLLTLNRADLLRDGKVVRLGVRRGVEVLAYLLHFGPRPLDLILRDVFSDLDRDRARNQFHQLRLRLKRLVPELDLEFQGGVYGLTGAVEWDLAARRGQGNEGLEFLPSSGSDWAQDVTLTLTSADPVPAPD